MQIGRKSIRLNPRLLNPNEFAGQFLIPNESEVGIIRIENSV